MHEIWKDVKGFEGLYQISNLGNVKSFKSNKVKILNPWKNKEGYLFVNLRLNGKGYTTRVHTMVCEAFIEKHFSKDRLVVDHIDGNRDNNHYNNLQWLSDRENVLKGNGINRNKLLGVHYHKNVDNYSCFIRIKKDRIHLAWHKFDVNYLSKIYNKAVDLREMYNGDKEYFRNLVKESI